MQSIIVPWIFLPLLKHFKQGFRLFSFQNLREGNVFAFHLNYNVWIILVESVYWFIIEWLAKNGVSIAGSTLLTIKKIYSSISKPGFICKISRKLSNSRESKNSRKRPSREKLVNKMRCFLPLISPKPKKDLSSKNK